MPSEQPRVLQFTAHAELEGLDTALQSRGFNVTRMTTLAEAQEALALGRERTVALLDTYRPAPYSFASLYALLHEPPAVPTLLILPENGPTATPLQGRDFALNDDVVRMPASIDELALRLQALLLRAGLPWSPAGGDLPAPQAASPAPPVAAPLDKPGEVIVMLGPKGGVGRSTISTNLAVGLAKYYAKRVVLIDADLWFGDLPVLLDVPADRTMALLAAAKDHELDADTVHQVLVPHPCGLNLVLAPGDPAQVETIPPSLPAQLATICRTMFDYVVVDTHPSMEEYMLQLLEVADRILLVTTPELAAIRSTAQALRLAPTLGWADKVNLVLNRANSGVHVDQLQDSLGIKVAATVVSAGPRVVDAANRGQPIVLSDPEGREQITRDLARLAAGVVGQPEPRWQKGDRGGGLGLLRRSPSKPSFPRFVRR